MFNLITFSLIFICVNCVGVDDNTHPDTVKLMTKVKSLI